MILNVDSSDLGNLVISDFDGLIRNADGVLRFTVLWEGCKAKELYEVFKSYGDIDEVVIPYKRDIRGIHCGFMRFIDVECKTKEMYEVFKNFGDIDVAVIPYKRDISGRRYGFVRFFDVEDERWLATKLNNIFLKSQKIFVNVPRFNKGNMEGVQDKPETRKVRQYNSFRTRGEVRSYAQVVRNNGDHRRTNFRRRTWSDKKAEVKPYTAHHEFTNEDEKTWVRSKRAYIGIMDNPGSTYNIQDMFNFEGYFAIQVTLLGSNLCLLEERGGGGLNG
ncbi:hypothetical protein KIW84_063506 [Lathyrus oleraceus]|uniref:RRM domain-containing protein n=1 Tax=Pisum sativum TaxID=3888 RepID=A0A9D4W7V2_PEA|nr:hypothetical protein KIW84_063506 [Pisum sativum]